MKTIYNSLVTIDNFLRKNSDKQIEKTILSDLTRSPKKISSMFFYDEKGSKLFEEITKLPEYYLTRTEIPLIKKAAGYLKDTLKNVNIIEFGSGDPTKISLILESIPEKNQEKITYVPLDVSHAAIQESCNFLLQKYPQLTIHGIVADFMTQLEVIPKKSNKVLCFLGSTIGNFTRKQAEDFLKELHHIMHPGDRLLLGFDMVKNKEIIENAYNDDQKVTEQFNKNILTVVNNLVGTDFNPDDFEHVAFYNDAFSRIEMHLKATKQIKISSPLLSTPITIKRGELIHTENSHKFTIDHIYKLAANAHFEIEKIFSDEKQWFSLAVLTKPMEQYGE